MLEVLSLICIKLMFTKFINSFFWYMLFMFDNSCLNGSFYEKYGKKYPLGNKF